MVNVMNQTVMIDTDILIDAGRGAPEATACLQLLEHDACLAVSVITQMELMVGCRNKKESKALERFLARFQILKLSEAISNTAVTLLRNYRLSHGILIADALIAATALYLDCSFVSKNQRDYQFIEGLHLLSYPNPSM
jgi:predicted nucleic acid-binding protein